MCPLPVNEDCRRLPADAQSTALLFSTLWGLIAHSLVQQDIRLVDVDQALEVRQPLARFDRRSPRTAGGWYGRAFSPAAWALDT